MTLDKSQLNHLGLEYGIDLYNTTVRGQLKDGALHSGTDTMTFMKINDWCKACFPSATLIPGDARWEQYVTLAHYAHEVKHSPELQTLQEYDQRIKRLMHICYEVETMDLVDDCYGNLAAYAYDNADSERAGRDVEVDEAFSIEEIVILLGGSDERTVPVKLQNPHRGNTTDFPLLSAVVNYRLPTTRVSPKLYQELLAEGWIMESVLPVPSVDAAHAVLELYNIDGPYDTLKKAHEAVQQL